MLHLVYTVDWAGLRELKPKKRRHLAVELSAQLQALFTQGERDESGGAYHVLGHKGDLMLVLVRRTAQELAQAERELASLPAMDYLEASWSYLSVVELSLHGSAERNRSTLLKKGLEEGSPEWDAALEEMLARDREAQRARLFPQLPNDRYLCFYPMSKKRGEAINWFTLSPKERGAMMASHGKTGRKYFGRVSQIISSSMGLDDWDWGVDLFAEKAVWFKNLIYEMRYDEVSAVYADFGPFILGVRVDPELLLEEQPWTQDPAPDYEEPAPPSAES